MIDAERERAAELESLMPQLERSARVAWQIAAEQTTDWERRFHRQQAERFSANLHALRAHLKDPHP